VWDGLGEPSGGVGGAGEEVGDRAAGGLAAEPQLEDRLGVRGHLVEQDGGAVDKADHDPGVGCADRAEGGELVVGQVHVAAVEAFGFGGRGEPRKSTTASASRAAVAASSRDWSSSGPGSRP